MALQGTLCSDVPFVVDVGSKNSHLDLSVLGFIDEGSFNEFKILCHLKIRQSPDVPSMQREVGRHLPFNSPGRIKDSTVKGFRKIISPGTGLQIFNLLVLFFYFPSKSISLLASPSYEGRLGGTCHSNPPDRIKDSMAKDFRTMSGPSTGLRKVLHLCLGRCEPAEISHVDLAPLGVHHDCDSEPLLLIKPPHLANDLSVPFVRAVAHVHPRNVHSTDGQSFQLLRAASSWADRTNQLRPPRAPESVLLELCLGDCVYVNRRRSSRNGDAGDAIVRFEDFRRGIEIRRMAMRSRGGAGVAEGLWAEGVMRGEGD
ncbi:hypothetical protein M5K25_014635 [Dendrobium thyrsiflorum]|uniref:Uncharacterized protein n=1 Tax=Dendrobium thyrsiflorum TaxID=117978 RepID=A0ABD0UP04_DENTH